MTEKGRGEPNHVGLSRSLVTVPNVTSRRGMSVETKGRMHV